MESQALRNGKRHVLTHWQLLRHPLSEVSVPTLMKEGQGGKGFTSISRGRFLVLYLRVALDAAPPSSHRPFAAIAFGRPDSAGRPLSGGPAGWPGSVGWAGKIGWDGPDRLGRTSWAH